MNIVNIVEDLQEYLKTHNGSPRSLDALEESAELLKQDLTWERRGQEIKRVGEILDFQLEKEAEAGAANMKEQEERRQFAEKIRTKLMACREECISMAKRKAAEQSPLITQLEEAFMVDMNAGLNGGKMADRENFSRLVRDCRSNISARVRPVISGFAAAVIEELEFCMETIRKNFVQTQIKEYKTNYQEINSQIMINYDTMKKKIIADCDNYEYPPEQFEQFSKDTGEKLEKLSVKERRVTGLIKLFPLILYALKYVCDNYLFPKETWMDKLMSFFISLLEKMSGDETGILVGLAEAVLQFVQENAEVFAITFELLTVIIFIGWLYYIYIKIVENIRKKSLCRKQQAVMARASENFIQKLDIRSEIEKVLTETEHRVTESYLKKHQPLLARLRQEEAEEPDNFLTNLKKEYRKYMENGGL